MHRYAKYLFADVTPNDDVTITVYSAKEKLTNPNMHIFFMRERKLCTQTSKFQ